MQGPPLIGNLTRDTLEERQHPDHQSLLTSIEFRDAPSREPYFNICSDYPILQPMHLRVMSRKATPSAMLQWQILPSTACLSSLALLVALSATSRSCRPPPRTSSTAASPGDQVPSQAWRHERALAATQGHALPTGRRRRRGSAGAA